MTAALEEGVSGQQHAPGKTRYPFYRRLGGPQGRSGRAENIVPTGIKSRTVQPIVSRYTDWATRPTVYIYIYIYIYIYMSQSQWTLVLRRRSATSCMLGLRVRILPVDMDVCLLRFLCVVRQRYPRRAYHPSRGVLATAMRLSVIVKSR